MTLEQLEELGRSGQLSKLLIQGSMLLPELPAEHYPDETMVQIRQGRDFHASPFVIPSGAPLIKALNSSGELVAIAEMRFRMSTIPRLCCRHRYFCGEFASLLLLRPAVLLNLVGASYGKSIGLYVLCDCGSRSNIGTASDCDRGH